MIMEIVSLGTTLEQLNLELYFTSPRIFVQNNAHCT